MEQLRNIEQCLVGFVQGQMSDLKKVNAKELGEVVDMIKDIEESLYYCQIIEAMEKTAEKEEKSQPMNISYYMEGPSRYYDGQLHNNDGQSSGSGNMRNYVPYMEYAPYMMRDKTWREDHLTGDGRSYYSRRMYMESKQDGSDNQKSMKELEHYMKDLGEELTEMITSSTPEEKQVLANKLQVLASKVMK